MLIRSVKIPVSNELSKWVVRGFKDEVYFCPNSLIIKIESNLGACIFQYFVSLFMPFPAQLSCKSHKQQVEQAAGNN